MSDRYLILENGIVFKGKPFGFEGEAVGELVFTTGMTGYLETLSDPSYFGQIVLSTFPLIGNCGVNEQDAIPGPVYMKAYIVRQWCQEPSNFRSEGDLDAYLRAKKTPGLYGIDTRALASIIRKNGAMNAMVSDSPELSSEQWAALRGYSVTDAVAAVYAATGAFTRKEAEQSILIWDFGGAFRLVEQLKVFGLSPDVVPYFTPAEEIMTRKPDGLILSGGPGNPCENQMIVKEIEKLCRNGLPILGVGLGHQMLALARGGKTEKLPFGHRGANQPVREKRTSRVFVTAQNHGYAVTAGSLPDAAAVSYINLNDGTCEGVVYKDAPTISVQFEPTDEVIAEFLTLLK